ncbi:ABC transporter permease [Christensenella tenuis]|jgi:ABC-2 type transport system permease protein|uniref:ABC transporter permease n=1 Tax=Christensenella tenuis TaxID=2763033 RepID=A0ABR7EEY8_9FIRM|nr:ABC transporter permease [Christensenella tenuis]MBC5648330.1 ABC transporter permease [Christensenella tenuis]
MKKLTLRFVGYELRNAVGNWFSVFFGVAFPILMSLLISKAFAGEMPAESVPAFETGVFISMSLVVPMATLLIGYAANYSQELEKEVPLRLRLFGCPEGVLLGAKMIANLIFVTAALAVYTAADILLLRIEPPAAGSALLLVFSIYLLALILFVLAHGVATLFGRFGPTYAVTMTLYFGFMIICGLMGVPVERLPAGVQAAANVLPMTYIGNDFAGFWQGGSYDFGPLVLSFAILGAISFAILLLGLWKRRRRKIS